MFITHPPRSVCDSAHQLIPDGRKKAWCGSHIQTKNAWKDVKMGTRWSKKLCLRADLWLCQIVARWTLGAATTEIFPSRVWCLSRVKRVGATRRDETRRDETRRDETRRDETRRDETRRDETRRDETRRDETRRDETRRDEKPAAERD